MTVSALVVAATPAVAQPWTAVAQPRTAGIAVTAGAHRPLPGMIEALQRDLHLTAAQAQARMLNEIRLTPIAARLARGLGDRYGGSWLTGATAQTLMVATTSSADIPQIRAAGALPQVVSGSLAHLNSIKDKLDAALPAHPATVGGVRFVDVRTNSVTVLSEEPGKTHAVIKSIGLDGSAVRVVESAERPRPLYDLMGGDAYYIGTTTRCSIGFPVVRGTQKGFVSAGHCGRAGQATSGFNRVAQGTFQASVFPVSDFSWVGVNTNWTPRPSVNNGSGGVVNVAGAREAIEGASVCRSGSTSTWHCGVIQQRNASVTYSQGTVYELTRTSVCAEPGDSGGPFISIDQAQGVTSGGSGDCTSGGITYFQPVSEILSTYGLSLVTTVGNPPPSTGACTGFPHTVTGSLTGGRYAYQPDDLYYNSAVSGVHSACLDGPEGADFDLHLQKWNGWNWVTVASAAGPNPDERIGYTGTAGYYRYRVDAASGSGSYSLAYRAP
ncbi:S1 family peptidase [Sphaerisporangium sp. NPDC005288]|uniref:S1 family peptidase n=1 Tax=Sphaerisporangium sp. NPDC005288 TaxID=3155114 RepID=UPI0033AA71A5